jgi:hypothetical protein
LRMSNNNHPTSKHELLNEYAKLRSIDWFNAGDITIRRMEWAFDNIKRRAKCFTVAELSKMIREIKDRHNKDGIVVI